MTANVLLERRARRGGRLACRLLLMCAFLALVPVQRRIDLELGIFAPIADVLYVPSGKILKGLCLGNEGLLANIYWTRVVQYFGRKRLAKSTRFDLLDPLLRVTTDLDPHLLIAYRFGAIFLSAKPPEGAGQPQQALDLLRRGIATNSGYWRLWQDLGFIYYWDLKDYQAASKAFLTGSQLPGAAVWMKALAATVAARGGETQTSRILWSEIYRNAETDDIRRSALEHLAALEAKQQIARLNSLLSEFRAREGHSALSFRELIGAGLLPGLPKDPSGIPYIVGADGPATLGPRSQINLSLLQ